MQLNRKHQATQRSNLDGAALVFFPGPKLPSSTAVKPTLVLSTFSRPKCGTPAEITSLLWDSKNYRYTLAGSSAPRPAQIKFFVLFLPIYRWQSELRWHSLRWKGREKGIENKFITKYPAPSLPIFRLRSIVLQRLCQLQIEWDVIVVCLMCGKILTTTTIRDSLLCTKLSCLAYHHAGLSCADFMSKFLPTWPWFMKYQPSFVTLANYVSNLWKNLRSFPILRQGRSGCTILPLVELQHLGLELHGYGSICRPHVPSLPVIVPLWTGKM